MADLDVDRARKVGVAVPPATKEEYLEASSQLAPGYTATADASDPSVGWTAQHAATDEAGKHLVDVPEGSSRDYIDPSDTLPGQVYLPEQLPDPQLAIQAGLAPVKIPEHLITTDVNHIQGPEPSERATFDYRDAVRRGVVANRLGEALSDDDDGDLAEVPEVPAAEPPAATLPAKTPAVAGK